MVEGTRARSADNSQGPQRAAPESVPAPAQAPGQMDRLATILEEMMEGQQSQDPRPNYKTPRFDRTGDVDYFIHHFERESARGNQWHREAAFLYLREALREGATDCGIPDKIDGICTAL